ncbi:hypothetical protein [Prescottella subtropica]|uniref:hypothetical protein n=1 Tax=Prescottella subtropica TaxID=2545757 RepID=UPI0010F6566F|nr:hypothetical protein [Prescottella subtropica]
MNDSTPNGHERPVNGTSPDGNSELRDRLESIRIRQQGLTISGQDFGIFYDEANPFDADLQVTFDDGSAVNNVVLNVSPPDLVELRNQIDEVLAMQRTAVGEPPEPPTSPASDLSVSAGANGEGGGEAADTDGSDEDHDDEDRSRFERASDPMNLRGLVGNLPPIAGVDSRTWLPIIVAILIVFTAAAFLGSMF